MFQDDDIIKKSFRYLMIYPRVYATSVWEKFFTQPDDFFQLPNIQYIKNTPGDSSTVAVVEANGIAIVVKRYNIKYLAHRMRVWFRRSRAMSSWLNARRLQALGIATVEPIAMIEERFGWLRGRAFFIYRYINGQSCGDYFFVEQGLSEKVKQGLQDMAETLYKLSQAKIVHRDMHHNNLVYQAGRVAVVDLDCMRQYRFALPVFKRKHQKEVAKFIFYMRDNTAAKEYFCEELARLKESVH